LEQNCRLWFRGRKEKKRAECEHEFRKIGSDIVRRCSVCGKPLASVEKFKCIKCGKTMEKEYTINGYETIRYPKYSMYPATFYLCSECYKRYTSTISELEKYLSERSIGIRIQADGAVSMRILLDGDWRSGLDRLLKHFEYISKPARDDGYLEFYAFTAHKAALYVIYITPFDVIKLLKKEVSGDGAGAR